jgi:hypothetical protein
VFRTWTDSLDKRSKLKKMGHEIWCMKCKKSVQGTPQTPYAVRTRTRAAEVGSQRPCSLLLECKMSLTSVVLHRTASIVLLHPSVSVAQWQKVFPYTTTSFMKLSCGFFNISVMPKVVASVCIFSITVILKSLDCSVVIAAGYGLDGRDGFPVGSRGSSPQRPDRHWGPVNHLSNGYRSSLSGEKRPEREADHLPASNTEVKNGGSLPPLPHNVFTAWCLIN